MRVLRASELDSEALRALCDRKAIIEPELVVLCQEIFQEVGSRGDEALIAYTRKYDGVELQRLEVAKSQWDQAAGALSARARDALAHAAANIETFHRTQIQPEEVVTVEPGVTCWRIARPIERVGLYVPGGTAVLPSTVLMLAIPARLAGCPRICLCVPPDPKGEVSPAVLEAARLAGIERVFSVGGAQAVAAMALGTETIPAVDKILGPGSRIVQAAKLLATFQGVAIDMVAGPSEVLIVADASADAELVAADLIAQAEHGSDSIAVLVTDDEDLARAAAEEVETQARQLPRRELICRSLTQSFALVTASLDEALSFANQFAPEHLLLQVLDPSRLVDGVRSAGAVFLGRWSPEVAGDYGSGANHTLPTAGWARSTSGVSVESFVKQITVQQLLPEGLQRLGPTLEELARLEALDGHRLAVSRRLRQLQEVGA